MGEEKEDIQKKLSAMVRDEKTSFRRLKDITHKYRTIFRHLAGRSGTLTDRLTHLMSNRDEAKTSHETVLMNLRLTRQKAKRAVADIEALRIKKDALVSRYDSLLEGKLPPAPSAGKDAGMAERKERFMERLSESFAEIEKEMQAADTDMKKLEAIAAKLDSRAAALAVKAGIEETRLSLFQKNIREVLLEMNNEEANIKQLAEEYAEMAGLMKKAKDLSPWGMKIFKEAVKEELAPGVGFIELGKDPGVNQAVN